MNFNDFRFNYSNRTLLHYKLAFINTCRVKNYIPVDTVVIKYPENQTGGKYNGNLTDLTSDAMWHVLTVRGCMSCVTTFCNQLLCDYYHNS